MVGRSVLSDRDLPEMLAARMKLEVPTCPDGEAGRIKLVGCAQLQVSKFR